MIESIYHQERRGAKVTSFIDKDARHGVKAPGRMFTGYKAHVAEDEHEIVTSVEVLPGNENEGEHLETLLEEEETQLIRSESVVADALYDSAKNRTTIHSRDMKAYIPCRRKRKKGKEFIYDITRDIVQCPQGKHTRSKNREGSGHFYNFVVTECKQCPQSDKCTIFRGNRCRIWISDDYILKKRDEDDFYKEALSIRKKVERKFGEGKKWHGLGRARYRGIERVSLQVLMTFMVMNIKRMVKLIREGIPNPDEPEPNRTRKVEFEKIHHNSLR